MNILNPRFPLTLSLAAVTFGVAVAQSPDISRPQTGGRPMALTAKEEIASRALMGLMKAVQAGQSITYTVNHTLNRGIAARIENGQVLIPARFFEGMGKEVIWLPQDKRVTIRERSAPSRSIDFDARENADNKAERDMRPRLIKGRVYVPMLPALMAFNATPQWLPNSRTLDVQTDPTTSGGR